VGTRRGAIRQDAFGQWRTNLFEGDVLWELRTPRQFEQAALHTRPEDLDQAVRVSSDLEQHAAWIRDYMAVGLDEISLHNVATNQRSFIEAFGTRVLPLIRDG
jgi:alkanesulfonate monooxygenase SsuD/methylene tetrahydromethanopterin reductase-like flavin-dependent oxidoreductase (luciferase family)